MDRRTKRQKLQAMANQSVSPNEAEIAQRLLNELPPDPPKIINPINTVYINGRAFTYSGHMSVSFTGFYTPGSGTPYGFTTQSYTASTPKK